MTAEHTGIIYLILDGNDRIVGSGGHALPDIEQGRADPKSAALGTVIYDHVAGTFTKKFLRDFLRGVRKTGRPATKAYRCDSPFHKRLMEMTAYPMPDGGVRMEHRTVAVEARLLPVHFRIPAFAGQAAFLRCSHCNRFRPRGETEWHEPEKFMPGGGELTVIHTVCPDCRNGIWDVARSLKRSDRPG